MFPCIRKLILQKRFRRHMHFLCDAIELKHSVKLALRVQGKSLKIDWIKFILQLICTISPYPCSPRQAFREGKSFSPSQAKQLLKGLSVYLFLKFEPQLGKSEEFNNHVMKENRVFRSYFYHQKNNRQGLYGIFLKP